MYLSGGKSASVLQWMGSIGGVWPKPNQTTKPISQLIDLDRIPGEKFTKCPANWPGRFGQYLGRTDQSERPTENGLGFLMLHQSQLIVFATVNHLVGSSSLSRGANYEFQGRFIPAFFVQLPANQTGELWATW